MKRTRTKAARKALGDLFAGIKRSSMMLCFVLLSLVLTDTSKADRINFNRDIRPILSDRCFHCHGPSQKNREANLRLDRPDGEDGALTQQEMAFRMQTSVQELTDLSGESRAVMEMYGPEVKKTGSFARNCLLARRMAERDVRFIQLFHRGWDHHSNLPTNLRGQARDVDQPIAGLLKDLRQRGLLEDTLVVFAGEFGRTTYAQGMKDRNSYGRDHHPRCFTTWMAGGGIKGGISYGETDDFCYNIARDPVHIRDFHATMLHQLGIDHRRLTFPYQGLDQRLTGVEPSRVIKEIVS